MRVGHLASMQTVISVGIDQELLSLREAVLRSAGFKVVTAWNAQRARLHLANTPAEVLLLCYSLPLTIRQELAEEFRRPSSEWSYCGDHKRSKFCPGN